jgi:hypothetical protein
MSVNTCLEEYKTIKVQKICNEIVLSNGIHQLTLKMPKTFERSPSMNPIDFGSIGLDSLLTDQGIVKRDLVSKLIYMRISEKKLISFILFSGLLDTEKISIKYNMEDGIDKNFYIHDNVKNLWYEFQLINGILKCIVRCDYNKYIYSISTHLNATTLALFIWDLIKESDNLNELDLSESDSIFIDMIDIPESVHNVQYNDSNELIDDPISKSHVSLNGMNDYESIYRMYNCTKQMVLTFEDDGIHDERTGECPDYMLRRDPLVIKVPQGKDVVIVYEN